MSLGCEFHADGSVCSTDADSSWVEEVRNSDNLIRPKEFLDFFFFKRAVAASAFAGDAGCESGCVEANGEVPFRFMEYGVGYSDS